MKTRLLAAFFLAAIFAIILVACDDVQATPTADWRVGSGLNSDNPSEAHLLEQEQDMRNDKLGFFVSVGVSVTVEALEPEGVCNVYKVNIPSGNLSWRQKEIRPWGIVPEGIKANCLVVSRYPGYKIGSYNGVFGGNSPTVSMTGSPLIPETPHGEAVYYMWWAEYVSTRDSVTGRETSYQIIPVSNTEGCFKIVW